MNMYAVVLVFIGGGLGSILRFLISKTLYQYTTHFPWATLCANAIGCFLIGLFLGNFDDNEVLNQQQKLFFVTGLCGGLTTFSTFTFENFSFIKEGQLLHFFGYSVFSFGLCLGLVLLGHQVCKYL